MPDIVIELPVRFRRCEAGDLPALEWMGLHTYEREIIERTFAAQERGEAIMLVAEAGGFPVAQAWLDFAECGFPARPLAWAIRVFPPLQRAGLGAALMAELEAVATRRGARELELGVERENAEARRFYRRLGYSPAGHRTEIARYSFEGYPFEREFRQEVLRKPLAAPSGRPGAAGAHRGEEAR